ncbi:hypothetical protein JCM11251_007138 [Rhodosporidiobolus azoricus]
MQHYPYASTSSPSTSHGGSASSSASSSKSSSPLLSYSAMPRRDSTHSLYSTSSSSDYSETDYATTDDETEDDEALRTPECSPALLAADATPASRSKGKGKAPVDLSASFHAFSLYGIDEEEWSIPVEPVQPLAGPTSTSTSTPAPAPLVPSAAFHHHQHQHPAVEPETVSLSATSLEQEQEEDDSSPRGRSRWPRLLWRSEVDLDSLTVLKSYHERALGRPLPRLRSGMRQESVGRWSRRMEDAGL